MVYNQLNCSEKGVWLLWPQASPLIIIYTACPLSGQKWVRVTTLKTGDNQEIPDVNLNLSRISTMSKWSNDCANSGYHYWTSFDSWPLILPEVPMSDSGTNSNKISAHFRVSVFIPRISSSSNIGQSKIRGHSSCSTRTAPTAPTAFSLKFGSDSCREGYSGPRSVSSSASYVRRFGLGFTLFHMPS